MDSGQVHPRLRASCSDSPHCVCHRVGPGRFRATAVEFVVQLSRETQSTGNETGKMVDSRNRGLSGLSAGKVWASLDYTWRVQPRAGCRRKQDGAWYDFFFVRLYYQLAICTSTIRTHCFYLCIVLVWMDGSIAAQLKTTVGCLSDSTDLQIMHQTKNKNTTLLVNQQQEQGNKNRFCLSCIYL